MSSLREAFLAALPDSRRDQAATTPGLDARLDTLWSETAPARDLGPTASEFIVHCAGRLNAQTELLESLQELVADDLYLACGCTLGYDAAVVAFRERMLSPVRAAAARVVSRDGIDDIVQETMSKLLVPGPDTAPAIAKYGGRGQLARWVQTVTLRLARSRARKRTEQPSDAIETLAERILETDDPELQALKRTYRAQFKTAFAAALAELSPRDRNLLRLELLDRLTLDAIAEIYQVHPVTVSRWRAALRKRLHVGTRGVFERTLRVDHDEFHSIMRLIGSQLDVSLPRLLQDE